MVAVKGGKRRKAGERKEEREEDEGAGQAAGEDPEADAPKPPKPKRRRRDTAAGPTEASPGGGGGGEEKPAAAAVPEDVRREAQREIQRLVMRLRAEGKSEAEIRAAKEEHRAKHGGLRKPGGRRELKTKAWQEWLRSETGQEKSAKERAERLSRKHDLVVIPVVWRGRHDMQDVLRAAEDVKACVAQQGVDVWLDARRHYTPGQKFAHWEHRGVMLRVEVGPDDLKAGVCRVCRAQTPGDYKSVERRSVPLPPAGARKLLLALKDWGLSTIAVERRPGDAEGEAEASDAEGEGEGEEAPARSSGGRAKKKAAAVAAAAPDADDVEGNWVPHAKAKAKGHKGGSEEGVAKRKKPKKPRR